MNKDDDDDDPSPPESDPVSDLNADEMDKLMADLDDMDDNLFKSGSKGFASKNVSPDDKKDSKNVSFQKDLRSSKIEDDWDADDLLNSDDEGNTKKKDKGKSSNVSPSSNLASSKVSPPKSPLKVSPSPNKKKLLSDLFDDSKSDYKEKLPTGKTNKKDKSDITFDGDSDPLNMDLKPKRATDDFMDSLLGKSSTTKPEKKSSDEFVLPDHYKTTDSKKSSPPKKTAIDDLFGDTDSRPRRRTTYQRPNKAFDFDDDILSGSKGKQRKAESAPSAKSKEDDWLSGTPKATPSKAKERTPSPAQSSTTEDPKSSSSPQKGDWLNQMLSANKSPSRQNKEISQPSHVSKSPKREAPMETPVHTQPTTTTSYPVVPPQTAVVISPHVPSSFDLQAQMVEHQSKLQAETAAITARMQMQQQETETQMLQQFQLQMQEQKQKMMQIMSQQTQMSLPSFTIGNKQSLFEDDESIKQLKIDLHKAQTEVGRLESELTLLREQHEKEFEIITNSHKKKESVEEGVYKRKEETIIKERDTLIESNELKLKQMEKEKEILIASYEAKLATVKAEMSDSLQRSKELYGNIIERMKSEHHNAVERLMELKNIELKAALTATGRVTDAESVLGLLEANTADLTMITNAVNEKHDSALELTKRALEVKEKQLKDMERNLGFIKAESESERNRLTVLVNRLENSLSNQGTEIETKKWSLAQDKMKIDVERTSLMEEKRHFQITMENERREFARSKETMIKEQKELLQTIAKQKSELYDIQSRTTTNFMTSQADMEMFQLKEEKKILEEKMLNLKLQQEEMVEDEEVLEEKRIKLEEESMKNCNVKETMKAKSLDLDVKSSDLERREERLEESKRNIQKRLTEIAQATQSLHSQQDSLSKERMRMELEQEEILNRMTRWLCRSCSSKLRTNSTGLLFPTARIAADDNGTHAAKPHTETFTKSFDRDSVLSRLKAAREEETRVRVKKQQLKDARGRKL